MKLACRRLLGILLFGGLGLLWFLLLLAFPIPLLIVTAWLVVLALRGLFGSGRR